MKNKFKKGDRVRIRSAYLKQGSSVGTIYANPKRETLVAVVWDGNKYPVTYHVSLLEPCIEHGEGEP